MFRQLSVLTSAIVHKLGKKKNLLCTQLCIKSSSVAESLNNWNSATENRLMMCLESES